MSLENQIRENMNKALKMGNKEEKQVYASILAALTSKSKELKSNLTPNQELEVLSKLFKQNQESIETCPTDRENILKELNFQKSIISQFMPTQMNETEINLIIQGVLNKLSIVDPTVRDKGKIMKELMPLIKGKADGKLVNSILEHLINI